MLKVALGKLLKKNGTGYFYLPTSLFFGDGAHGGFRNYSTGRSRSIAETNRNFAVETVYEFTSTKVFDGVNTAYCCAKFQGDTQQNFPVPYFKEVDGEWVEHKALPLKNPSDPWRIVRNLDELNAGETVELRLTSEQKPRQGVNTCGANNIFIFDHKPPYLPGGVYVSSCHKGNLEGTRIGTPKMDSFAVSTGDRETANTGSSRKT